MKTNTVYASPLSRSATQHHRPSHSRPIPTLLYHIDANAVSLLEWMARRARRRRRHLERRSVTLLRNSETISHPCSNRRISNHRWYSSWEPYVWYCSGSTWDSACVQRSNCRRRRNAEPVSRRDDGRSFRWSRMANREMEGWGLAGGFRPLSQEPFPFGCYYAI